MRFIIGIQPDDYGPGDAASPIWMRLLRAANHEVRLINVYSANILDQLRGCHGFMWRHAHFPNLRQIARRLLPVVERELGLVIYPDQYTCWHYDDKIAQSYLLQAKEIPIPKTWVWYDAKLAKNWAQEAQYPIVLKLWGGASSENVLLVRSYEEAELWIEKLFGRGVHNLSETYSNAWPWRKRIRSTAKVFLKGIPPSQTPSEHAWELHKNYILFQEFLPGNPFDTRITVIGKRAFGFRRFNRHNDFRASGSGKIDWTPEAVDPRFIRLAFRTASAIRGQSCAIDGLLRGHDCVVGEISYTYVSSAVNACPGHWKLIGDPDTGELIWQKGQMWPEEAQIADFLARLESYYKDKKP